MKTLHVSLKVADLGASIDFYTALLAAEPTVRKPDYARAGGEVDDEGQTVCCYHRSDKTWVTDGQGVGYRCAVPAPAGGASSATAPAAGRRASRR